MSIAQGANSYQPSANQERKTVGSQQWAANARPLTTGLEKERKTASSGQHAGESGPWGQVYDCSIQ